MGQTASGIPTSSRSSSGGGGGTNNLPPLLFHGVHGENIRISRDGAVARRVESFCKGIAFSARPVKVNEKICIKFLEISNNWSGVIRFGFTSNDPAQLRHGLPKYACPDLTNKPGFWAKALPERFCLQGTVLFYYVTATGDVHFGVNGEEKGVFFGGVETRSALYALIDVYGNSTAIEFLDFRQQLNNNSSVRIINNNQDEVNVVDRLLYPMQQMRVRNAHNHPHLHQETPSPPPVVTCAAPPPPQLRHQAPHLTFTPLQLHRTRGRNVRFGNDRSVALRTNNEFCQGYVFTGRPLHLNERIVVQILSTEAMFQGCLGLGLTSCDPALLGPSDLPDDSNFLLDRPEYWVLSRDFSRELKKGDEISFFIAPNGEVQISRNGGAPLVVIHVDQSLQLWGYFDIYGSTQKIRVFSCSSSNVGGGGRSPSGGGRSPCGGGESTNSLNSQSELNMNMMMCRVGGVEVVQTAPNGGAVLSVILPPGVTAQAHPVGLVAAPQQLLQQTAVLAASGGSSTYVEPVSPLSPAAAPPQLPTPGASTPACWKEPHQLQTTLPPTLSVVGGGGSGTECTICYENPIDAVLYMCGHMCMCYECALQQWRGKGGGHCPLCRALIRDVIRTYKS